MNERWQAAPRSYCAHTAFPVSRLAGARTQSDWPLAMGNSKQWTVLHGGSTNGASHYATTSAVHYRGQPYDSQRVASPWMGEPQSRFGYMSSGYQHAFYRDGAPGDLGAPSIAGSSFSRPKYTTMEETQPWTGQKDETPIKSCLHRGELKEPRFYPFKMGSMHGAQVLISPPESDPTARFETPIYQGNGEIDPNATILVNRGGKPPSGFATGNDKPAVAANINERQDDGIARTPALTMLQAERVAADSTKRFFHARDFYENPYLSSSAYYQTDALTQLSEMKRKKEALTAVPSTRPLTQYALAHNDAPYAPDVGDGVGLPIPRVGEGVHESWGMMPGPSTGGLMPTAYTQAGHGKTDVLGSTAPEPPPAPPLPERFARIRARHDYLRWGGTGGDDDRYKSTSRVELCKPSAQHPLGGPVRKAYGTMVIPSDSSGYHMQGPANPITPDPGC